MVRTLWAWGLRAPVWGPHGREAWGAGIRLALFPEAVPASNPGRYRGVVVVESVEDGEPVGGQLTLAACAAHRALLCRLCYILVGPGEMSNGAP